jgi:hypothetical protein
LTPFLAFRFPALTLFLLFSSPSARSVQPTAWDSDIPRFVTTPKGILQPSKHEEIGLKTDCEREASGASFCTRSQRNTKQTLIAELQKIYQIYVKPDLQIRLLGVEDTGRRILREIEAYSARSRIAHLKLEGSDFVLSVVELRQADLFEW